MSIVARTIFFICWLLALGCKTPIKSSSVYRGKVDSKMEQKSLYTLRLFYVGSGKGTTDGFTVQIFNADNRTHESYRSPCDALAFFRVIDSNQAIAVKGFGTGLQEIVITQIQSGDFDVVGDTKEGLLMYPAVSPDGANIACLFFAGRVDAPARTAAVAKLVVFPLVKPNPDKKPLVIAVFQVLAEDLPAIPFDWAPDGHGVYFTSVDPAQVEYVALTGEPSSFVRKGLFPRVSPNGEYLALINGKRIDVVKPESPGSIILSHQMQAHPTWLAWSPGGEYLAFAEELPLWRVRVSLLSVPKGKVDKLFEASKVRDLNWITKDLRWEKFFP
jgi:hypothetical protein